MVKIPNATPLSDDYGRDVAKPVEFKTFIRNLDALREPLGLTDAAICARAGIDPGYLSKLRKRKTVPKTETLAKIAKALDCEPWQLVGGAPPEATLGESVDPEMAAKALAYLVHRIARRFADEGRDLSKEKPVYSEWWMDQYQSLLAISDVLDQLDGDLDALPKVLEAAGRADPRATNGK